MPAEAFRDLWASIKASEPWSAMVKNRCKNGDHYWVSANVTPVLQHGQPVGYMSVRTKPSRAQVEAADALYAKMREANHDGEVRMRLHRGQLQRRGPARLWQRLTHLSLLGKLAAALFVTSCANEAALFLPLSGVWQLAVQLAVFAVAFTAALLWFRGKIGRAHV